MRLVFCCDPLRPREPDPAFQREVDAARSLGLPTDLIDHEALVRGRPAVNLSALPVEELAVYRGWMVTPAQYGPGTKPELFDLVIFEGWLPAVLPNKPILAIVPPSTSPPSPSSPAAPAPSARSPSNRPSQKP